MARDSAELCYRQGDQFERVAWSSYGEAAHGWWDSVVAQEEREEAWRKRRESAAPTP
ncbi:MAG: hypothetical protein AMXMBFR34_37860 [Myxococcaceae bacterium]